MVVREKKLKGSTAKSEHLLFPVGRKVKNTHILANCRADTYLLYLEIMLDLGIRQAVKVGTFMGAKM